ncbi:MAG: ATP-dependent sacrificial sulfur transferase LarE [Heliobacteriaceae bacterium]|nr:ATP-dependent sacrificial sulfur transferase LarE [Heliobacteriaceae bacterium]
MVKEAVLKYSRLCQCLLSLPHAVLAFSGGVDSTFLLAAWADAWRQEKVTPAPRLLACIIDSPLLPPGELAFARTLAGALGADYREIACNPLAWPSVAANGPDRCYHCKYGIFTRLQAVGREEGLPVIIEGTNTDDPTDFRPGHRAIAELGVRSPLAEAGLNKAEIRQLSQGLNLPTWNKPSGACLATRIPYGCPLSPANLGQVAAAEAVLTSHGFPGARVRHHGEIARIELVGPPGELFRKTDIGLISQAVKKLGFRYVTLDLEGYRTGSLNPPDTLPGDH